MPAPSKTDAILAVLTTALRIVSDEQAGRIWFAQTQNPRAAARSALRTLAAKNLVTLQTAMVHPELPLTAPVLDWRPNQPAPHLGRVAFRLTSRWTEAPQRTLIAAASARARARLGSAVGGRPVRSCEIAHDLGLATVFFLLCSQNPELTRRWRHEDELVRSGRFGPGEHIPDAILAGTPEVIVEFGGEYAARKLVALHQAYQHGPYQIW